jgi:hypothetical protein|nr:MAG TPA: ssDNA binding protein [Caudoviricetes sp.]
MNIIAKSANVVSAFDLYKLVQSPERKKLTDIKGQTIELVKWVLYTEPNKDGKEMNLLALSTVDGATYCTNSATFCRSFESAVATFGQFGEEFHSIQIVTGTSKNGRNYIDCVVVG